MKKLTTISWVLGTVLVVLAFGMTREGIQRLESSLARQAPGYLTRWIGAGQWQAEEVQVTLLPLPSIHFQKLGWSRMDQPRQFEVEALSLKLRPFFWLVGGPSWILKVDEVKTESGFLEPLYGLVQKWPLGVDGEIQARWPGESPSEWSVRIESAHLRRGVKFLARQERGILGGQLAGNPASLGGFVETQGEVRLVEGKFEFELRANLTAASVHLGEAFHKPEHLVAQVSAEGRISEHELGLDAFEMQLSTWFWRGNGTLRRQARLGLRPELTDVVLQARIESEKGRLEVLNELLPFLGAQGLRLSEGEGRLSFQVDGGSGGLVLTSEGEVENLTLTREDSGGPDVAGGMRWRWVSGQWELLESTLKIEGQSLQLSAMEPTGGHPVALGWEMALVTGRELGTPPRFKRARGSVLLSKNGLVWGPVQVAPSGLARWVKWSGGSDEVGSVQASPKRSER